MENCLVTKLKASVQNENLPIFETVIIDLTHSLSNVGSTIGFVMNGASQKSKMTVAPNVSVVSTGAEITDYNFNYFVGRIYGDNPVNKAVMLDNVYNMKTFLIWEPKLDTTSDYGNINAILSSENIKLFGAHIKNVSDVRIPKNCKAFYLSVDTVDIFEHTALLHTLEGIDRIKVLGTMNNGSGSPRLDVNNLPATLKPQVLVNWIITGDIQNMPGTVEYFNINSVASISGTVESFVQNSGKTSGQLYIYCARGSYSSGITFEGNSIIQNPDSNTTLKFSWNNGTITKETVSNVVLNGITMTASNIANVYLAVNGDCLNYIDSL